MRKVETRLVRINERTLLIDLAFSTKLQHFVQCPVHHVCGRMVALNQTTSLIDPQMYRLSFTEFP